MSPNSKKAFTHNDCRKKICLVCNSTSKAVRPANSSVYKNISTLHSNVKFDTSDARYPSGICTTHRIILSSLPESLTEACKNQISNLKFKHPNYDHVIVLDPDSMVCDCALCILIFWKLRLIHYISG